MCFRHDSSAPAASSLMVVAISLDKSRDQANRSSHCLDKHNASIHFTNELFCGGIVKIIRPSQRSREGPFYLTRGTGCRVVDTHHCSLCPPPIGGAPRCLNPNVVGARSDAYLPCSEKSAGRGGHNQDSPPLFGFPGLTLYRPEDVSVRLWSGGKLLAQVPLGDTPA